MTDSPFPAPVPGNRLSTVKKGPFANAFAPQRRSPGYAHRRMRRLPEGVGLMRWVLSARVLLLAAGGLIHGAAGRHELAAWAGGFCAVYLVLLLALRRRPVVASAAIAALETGLVLVGWSLAVLSDQAPDALAAVWPVVFWLVFRSVQRWESRVRRLDVQEHPGPQATMAEPPARAD
ncbi:MAG: hypothetical protein CMJ83_14370 [Planctomycetes bacterium]|nr:hypothetical protein [Planctomycetota bacterium]